MLEELYLATPDDLVLCLDCQGGLTERPGTLIDYHLREQPQWWEQETEEDQLLQELCF